MIILVSDGWTMILHRRKKRDEEPYLKIYIIFGNQEKVIVDKVHMLVLLCGLR